MNLAGLIAPHPDAATALVEVDGKVTTYGDLRREVGNLRAKLVAAGLAPDDRVAILSANDPAFVVAYLALLGIGAIAVPLNPGSPPAEIGRELGVVRAAGVLSGPGGGHAADSVERAGLSDVILIDLTEPVPGAGRDDADHGPVPAIVERRAEDLAALMFTSGTGGAPRPAMLTHGNLLANLDQVERHPGRAVTPDDVCLGLLPFFHIFGLNVVLGGSLLVGASVLVLDRLDAGAAIELIERHRVTILLGAPTMYAALAGATAGVEGAAAPSPAMDQRRLPDVRLAFSGAAPLALEVADACESRLGLVIRQGYGLTEAAPVVTSSLIDEPPRPGSIGVALPGLEVRIMDADNEEALAGDPGEIWVKGPNVFPGYWEDEAATEAALTPDGWLKTGDVAVMGDDGELYIVDRAKDLIIVSGFNVYPAEVEDALLEHPGVAEVAVVGESDPYRGEAVHAFVVAADVAKPPTADELIAFCGQRLARYKCPSQVIFMPSLPHGLGGKLLRRALRPA